MARASTSSLNSLIAAREHARIDVPVTLVYGEHDGRGPRIGRRTSSRFLARYIELRDTVTSPALEAPHEVERILRNIAP